MENEIRYVEKLVELKRVSKVVKGGKRLKIICLRRGGRWCGKCRDWPR